MERGERGLRRGSLRPRFFFSVFVFVFGSLPLFFVFTSLPSFSLSTSSNCFESKEEKNRNKNPLYHTHTQAKEE